MRLGACNVKRQPERSFDAALSRADSLADSGKPANCLSSSMMSSKLLVESSTFWENLVVSSANSTLIAATRSLPAGSSLAPSLRNSSNILRRWRFRGPASCSPAGLAAKA